MAMKRTSSKRVRGTKKAPTKRRKPPRTSKEAREITTRLESRRTFGLKLPASILGPPQSPRVVVRRLVVSVMLAALMLLLVEAVLRNNGQSRERILDLVQKVVLVALDWANRRNSHG
jgi:hypothetical protein